jgi:hypothetical protein
MTFDMDKISKVVDLAIKCEIHAVLLLLVGGVLALHGLSDMASLVIGGALAIFKGKTQ